MGKKKSGFLKEFKEFAMKPFVKSKCTKKQKYFL